MMKIFALIALIVISSTSCAIIDFSEKGWPAADCAGNRNSPIDFPSNFNYTFNQDYFRILSTEYKDINGLKFDVTNQKSYHIVNLTSQVYGTLMARKAGITYKYNLLDVHFHFLSEHTFGGKATEFEMHMVHQKDRQYLLQNNITDPDEDKMNEYLVVGTLFQVDGNTDNDYFNKFNIGKNETMSGVNLERYSNPNQPYYHYIGGLTTPPCSQVVNWVVNANVVKVSNNQNVAMRQWIGQLYPTGNTRRTMPLNGRAIYRVDPINFPTNAAGFLKGNLMFVFAALIAALFF